MVELAAHDEVRRHRHPGLRRRRRSGGVELLRRVHVGRPLGGSPRTRWPLTTLTTRARGAGTCRTSSGATTATAIATCPPRRPPNGSARGTATGGAQRRLGCLLELALRTAPERHPEQSGVEVQIRTGRRHRCRRTRPAPPAECHQGCSATAVVESRAAARWRAPASPKDRVCRLLSAPREPAHPGRAAIDCAGRRAYSASNGVHI